MTVLVPEGWLARLLFSRSRAPTFDSTPRNLESLLRHTLLLVAMDTDMTDAAYDIDIDVGAGVEPIAQHAQPIIEVKHA